MDVPRQTQPSDLTLEEAKEKENQWICVVIESPHSGTPAQMKRDMQYAICAMRDCLRRGEAPFASHFLYTHAPTAVCGAGNDNEQTVYVGRKAAIEAGLAWGTRADKTVVYQDFGITRGMRYGIESAKKANREIEYRTLPTIAQQLVQTERAEREKK